MTEQALSDVKVIELTALVSGPYCTKMLADLGAEVIKVEEPNVGDVTRRIGPFPNDIADLEQSAAFIYLNTNKLGITLDIKSVTGRRMLKELLAQSDVFVESNPRKMMEEFQLDYESLKKVNPELVVTSITPFGHSGPYRDYKGYDIHIGAAGTPTGREGMSDREPLSTPASQNSYYVALHAAAATMVAIYARRAGYHGQHVDVSEVRCWATTNNMMANLFLRFQMVSKREGRQRFGFFPYGTYPVKDGFIFSGTLLDPDFLPCAEMMGHPEWLEDPRFKTMAGRWENRDELMALMKPWLESHTKAEVWEYGLSHKDSFKATLPLRSIHEVANDEHLKARKFFVESEHAKAGKLKYPGPPYRFTETPWQQSRQAPILGQHNEEVYCGRLGYTRQDLADLRRAGII